MRNLLFLLASLMVAPLFAQPLPYISHDVTFAQSLRFAPAGYDMMRVLPDNSFIISHLQTSTSGTPPNMWARIDSGWIARVSAEGGVLWERNLGEFFPLRVVPGPDSNITITGYTLQDISAASGPQQTVSSYLSKIIDPQGNIVQTSTTLPVMSGANCSIIANGLGAGDDLYGVGAVALQDGNYMVFHETYDPTKTALNESRIFNLSKISPLGQIIWSKKMPYYSALPICGLALMPNGNAVYSGLNFQSNNTIQYDNAAFTVNGAGAVLGISTYPRPSTLRQVAYTAFTDLREGFSPASNSGFWSWLPLNRMSPGGDSFPVVYQNETCDTLFAGLVPFTGNDSLWSTKPHRWIEWGVPTPGDNGFLLVVGESDNIQGNHYLLKLRSDGSVHWRSEQGGMSLNTGRDGYFTTDGDLIQLNLGNMRLTRWHIPKGTATETSLATSPLRVAPNPVHDQLAVLQTCARTGTQHLHITDLTGRDIYTIEVQTIADENKWQVPVAALAPGMYVLSVAGATGVAAQTVFVKE